MPYPRDNLARAVQEILRKHGTEGRPLSYRQVERRTGLSPATIGELCSGVARTRRTVLRFAEGMGESAEVLLVMAGFIPEETAVSSPSDSSRPVSLPQGEPLPTAAAQTVPESDADSLFPEERLWLGRLGKSLAQLPPGRDRALWLERLRQDAELLEAFLERLGDDRGEGETGGVMP
jgi:transcriptional regulator with XRE-family HTH domain